MPRKNDLWSFFAESVVSESMTNVRFGGGGFYEVEPIAAGLFLFFDRDDVDDLGIFNMIVKGNHLAIGFGTDCLMTDIAVDSIGEVDRRRFFGKLNDIAFRGKSEDVVFEKLNFKAEGEFLIIATDFFLPLFELADPGEFFGNGCSGTFAT